MSTERCARCFKVLTLFYKCSKCIKSCYCDKNCQVRDYTFHKLICDSISKGTNPPINTNCDNNIHTTLTNTDDTRTNNITNINNSVVEHVSNTLSSMKIKNKEDLFISAPNSNTNIDNNKQIDSILQQLAYSLTDISTDESLLNNADLLYSLAMNYHSCQNLELGLVVYQKLLLLYNSLSYSGSDEINKKIQKGIVSAQVGIGHIYANIGVQNLTYGIKLIESSLSMSKQINDIDEQVNSLTSLAVIYETMGNNNKCLENLFLAAPLAHQIKEYTAEVGLLMNSGAKLHDIGHYSLALHKHKEALSLAKAQIQDLDKKNELCAKILCNMGDTYNKLKDSNKSYSCYEEALILLGPILEKLEDKDLVVSLRERLNSFSKK